MPFTTVSIQLFARFDALLRAKGWLEMGGQIIDATVIEARRPRLTQVEKDTIKGALLHGSAVWAH